MTVEELEPRVTMRALLEWREFEANFGPLTIQERIDQAGAVVAWTVARCAGAEVDIKDFLPAWGKEEPVGHVADLFRALSH